MNPAPYHKPNPRAKWRTDAEIEIRGLIEKTRARYRNTPDLPEAQPDQKWLTPEQPLSRQQFRQAERVRLQDEASALKKQIRRDKKNDMRARKRAKGKTEIKTITQADVDAAMKMAQVGDQDA